MKSRIQKMVMAVSLMITICASVVVASATSWVELKPEEVKKRANVIITGKYDFSNKEKGKDNFEDYKFVIDKVYEGRVNKEVTVGIEMFDIGWAEEHQKNGGEFLLFLEARDKYQEFLSPIAGPNGMIQLKDGKVLHSNPEKTAFYTEILKGEFYEPAPMIKDENAILHKILSMVLGGLFIGITTYLLVKKKALN